MKKLHWGHYLVMAFILFISFILYMVFKINTYDFDLEYQNYYQRELSYQEVINARSSTDHLCTPIEVSQTAFEILLRIPQEAQPIEGTVHFYRPNNANFDRSVQIDSSVNPQHIPKTLLKKGQYRLELRWKSEENIPYYYEELLTVE